MKACKCIFCFNTNPHEFNTKEHIIPESLGSGDWAILHPGMFCDKCQNIFGSAIEQQALSAYPLNNFRTFFAIPTKKKKAPWFSYWEGKISSGGRPGTFIYEPNSYFERAFRNGTKIHTIIPAMPEKTDFLLRTLLKIGLETFAADLTTNDEIFDKKFDCARKYALTGKKEKPWFYIQYEDTDKFNKYINELTIDEWRTNFFADVHEEGELVYLHLKLLYLDFITPLVENVIPDPELVKSIKEPDGRLVFV